MEIDGTAYRAELADLDQDGWPEVYVYVSSAGSGSYGSLAAFAVNQGQTLEPIQLPPLAATPEAATGYQGHDEFRIVNGELLRRFPVYNETDTNAAPGGAVRQLHYHLHREDAKWQLRTVRVTTNDETADGSWPH